MKRTIQFIIISLITVALLMVFYFYFPHVWGEILYPLDYKESIAKYAVERNLEPNFVCAVIFTESRFHKDSVSGAGAVGLMQLMPGTARSIASEIGEPMGDLHDPDTNIKYGTWYLKGLMDKYGNNVDYTLAAYNAGSGRADSYKDYGTALPNETVGFISKVKGTKKNYDEIYGTWYIQTETAKANPAALRFTGIAEYVRTLILGQ